MAILTGTLLADEINGTSQADVVLALSGDDMVTGGTGADAIDGGDGNDTLYAGSHSVWRDGALDTVLGGFGDDTIYGGWGDILDGGIGFDRLYLDLTQADEGLTLDFRPMTLGLDVGIGGVGRIDIPLGEGRIGGFQAVSHMLGTAFADKFTLANADASSSFVDAAAGDDYVRTGRGDDRLIGGEGRDTLSGSAGADRLDGGLDDDRLIGGRGHDELTGGAGADRFVFSTGSSAASRLRADEITDFSQGDHDRIVLGQIDANVATEDNDRFTFVGDAKFSGTAGELRFAQVDGATFVSGDTNGDAVADFVIRLDGLVDLTRGDFGL